MDEPTARVSDDRSYGERMAWRMLGAPLYYCEDCLRRVNVAGDPPEVVRSCDHADARVIAPRRAIVHGEGGLSPANKLRMSAYKIASAITGRVV
jgi:hypothetical protein